MKSIKEEVEQIMKDHPGEAEALRKGDGKKIGFFMTQFHLTTKRPKTETVRRNVVKEFQKHLGVDADEVAKIEN